MAKTTGTGSTLVAALEALWEQIRRTHPELPAHVVFVTGSGNTGLGQKWAHFDRNGWLIRGQHSGCDETCDAIHVGGSAPEIFISGERFQAGAKFVVQSVLHEAAHALAALRDVKETSRGNRYHNKRFVALAEELGMEYAHAAPDVSIGFSAVTITAETELRYSRQIALIERAVNVFRPDPAEALDLGALIGLLGGAVAGPGVTGRRGRRGPATGSRSLPKAECGCESPRIIRVARAVFEVAPITCGECGESFTLVD